MYNPSVKWGSIAIKINGLNPAPNYKSVPYAVGIHRRSSETTQQRIINSALVLLVVKWNIEILQAVNISD